MTGDDGNRPTDEGASGHVPYEVEVPGFSGPLELLLHLIRKHKLDILDIPMSFITQKYLEYIDMMQVLNLDVAAEYLETAATLTRIKSRMLLPPGDDEETAQEAEEGGDPRAELVRRLLEYQKYRDAGDQLLDLDQLHRDVFARPYERPADAAERPLEEVGLAALLDVFAKLIEARKIDVSHQVAVERVSVAERIGEMVDVLRVRKRVVLEQLLEGAWSRLDLVVTVLALLEMTRLRMTRLLQADPDAPLYVEFVGGADAADAAGERQ